MPANLQVLFPFLQGQVDSLEMLMYMLTLIHSFLELMLGLQLSHFLSFSISAAWRYESSYYVLTRQELLHLFLVLADLLVSLVFFSHFGTTLKGHVLVNLGNSHWSHLMVWLRELSLPYYWSKLCISLSELVRIWLLWALAVLAPFLCSNPTSQLNYFV